MSSKPENTFRRGVHNLLSEGKPYHVKMNNPYAGGIPDDWYSGSLADLWVEYKFVILPKRETTIVTIELSELQREWLRDRYNEGRNVAVVVGSKQGCVIYQNLTWETDPTMKQFMDACISKQRLANWLVLQTMRGADATKSLSHDSEGGHNSL